MLQEKMFIGPRGVDVLIESDLKTYGGADVITVQYDGGHTEIMPRKTYELLASTEPSDLTAIRNKKFNAIYEELYPLLSEYLLNITKKLSDKAEARTIFLGKAMSVITEYDIKVSEIEPLLNPVLAEMDGAVNALSNELDNTMNRATNYLWTKNDTSFIPGVNMMMERTVLEAKKICDDIPAPEKTEEVSTTDGTEQATTE